MSFAIFLILEIGRSADAQTHADVLPTETGTVRVDAMAGHAINSFDPDRALIDGCRKAARSHCRAAEAGSLPLASGAHL